MRMGQYADMLRCDAMRYQEESYARRPSPSTPNSLAMRGERAQGLSA